MDQRQTDSGAQTLPRIGLVRQVTDTAVLAAVIRLGPSTRAEVARVTGISKPTVTTAVQRLETAGLLREDAATGTGTRRNGARYALGGAAGFIGAIDVRPDRLALRFVDLAGEVILRRDLARHPEVDDPAPQLRSVVAGALRSVQRHATPRGVLRALAISFANPVDTGGARLVPLADRVYDEAALDPAGSLRELVDVPVLVENDVNLAALAERAAGALGSLDDFVFVHVGVGVGAAIVLGGHLVRGTRGLAGELSYVSVWDDRSVPERRGLPVALARAGLSDRADTFLLDVPTALALCDAAADGIESALDAVSQAGRLLGRAITSVCAVVDPQAIVLGGPIGRHPAIAQAVRRTVDELAPVPVPILSSRLDDDAPMDGAIATALTRARSDLLARP